MDRTSQNKLLTRGLTLLRVEGKTLHQRTSVNGNWRIMRTFVTVEKATAHADELVRLYARYVKL